jgi:DinB superfamily
MNETVERLRSLLDQIPGRLEALTEAETATVPAAGKWSKKQILGHLIDSASNNHQRFVRAQLTTPLNFPGYTQNEWVEAQAYASEVWSDLVRLWTAYNLHLVRVIAHIPEEKLGHLCRIGEDKPVTLGFLAEDYVAHMEHHLAQILGAEGATAV